MCTQEQKLFQFLPEVLNIFQHQNLDCRKHEILKCLFLGSTLEESSYTGGDSSVQYKVYIVGGAKEYSESCSVQCINIMSTLGLFNTLYIGAVQYNVGHTIINS